MNKPISRVALGRTRMPAPTIVFTTESADKKTLVVFGLMERSS